MDNCSIEEYPKYYNWDEEKKEYHEVPGPSHDHYTYNSIENSWYEVKI